MACRDATPLSRTARRSQRDRAARKKVPADNRAAGQALDRRNGWLRKTATEAIVVWDHDEPRIGKVVQALEQVLPDDVWIVSP